MDLNMHTYFVNQLEYPFDQISRQTCRKRACEERKKNKGGTLQLIEET